MATGVLLGVLVSFAHYSSTFATEYSASSVLIAADDDAGEEDEDFQHWGSVPLLEQFGSAENIDVNPQGELPILTYVNEAWEWLEIVAFGIVLLWVLVSGGMIILLGGDQSKRGEWIEHMKWAIIGLITLALIGVLLNFLNASFFN